MSRLECDPGDYCPTHIGDCSACELAHEAYGPPPELAQGDEDPEGSDD